MVAGIILAGGRSRRFGSDKALALIDGEPMISRVATLLAMVANPIVVVTNRPEAVSSILPPTVQFIADIVPDIGPLGGLWSGLSATDSSSCFVLGCDLPYVRPSLLRLMLRSGPGYDAVIPLYQGRPEPLIAWYTRSCQVVARDLALNHPGASLQDLLRRLNVRYLAERDYAEIDPTGESFRNINRPDDLLPGSGQSSA